MLRSLVRWLVARDAARLLRRGHDASPPSPPLCTAHDRPISGPGPPHYSRARCRPITCQVREARLLRLCRLPPLYARCQPANVQRVVRASPRHMTLPLVEHIGWQEKRRRAAEAGQPPPNVRDNSARGRHPARLPHRRSQVVPRAVRAGRCGMVLRPGLLVRVPAAAGGEQQGRRAEVVRKCRQNQRAKVRPFSFSHFF